MSWIGPSAWRLRWYRAVRYSPLYDWYTRVRRPGYAAALASDRRFFRTLFAAHRVGSVFDVGANVGDKARVFRELTCRLVCIEADPESAETLRSRFRGRSGVAVDSVAVGEAIGTAVLHRKRFSGYNTLSEKWSDHSATLAIESRDAFEVPVTTLDHLIDSHYRPDYIKIDVEGYELPVVRGLSKAVKILSFEANLPVFGGETLHVIDHLEGLNPAYRFNLRKGDCAGFLLPDHVDAAEIVRFVTGAGTITYDIFAIGSSSSADGLHNDSRSGCTQPGGVKPTEGVPRGDLSRFAPPRATT